MNEEDYKSDKSRQEFKSKIAEAIKKSGVNFPKTAEEFEECIFAKSQNKNEYMNYLWKLVSHINQTGKNGQANGQSQQQMQHQNSQIQNQQIHTQQMSNQQMQSQQISSQQLQTQQYQNQQIQNQAQQQNIQTSMGNQINNLGNSQNGNDQNNSQLIESNQMNMNQVSHIQQSGNNQINSQSTQSIQGQHMQRVPIPQTRMMMNQIVGPNGTPIQRPAQMMPQNIQIGHRIRQPNANMPIQIQPQQEFFQNQQQNQSNTQSTQQNIQQQQFQNVVPQQFQNNVQVVQNQNGPIGQVNTQHPAQNTMQMAPSPSSYVPSPSNIMSSPMNVNMMGQRGPPSVPSIASPNPTLNTPVMTANASPNMRQMSDEQFYKEKLKQLSKYIEPLKKMIVNIESGDNTSSKKDSSKIKTFLEIISDPNKRCPVDVLLKCEQVLDRCDPKIKMNLLSGQSTNPPVNQHQTIQQNNLTKNHEFNICQPLLEALKANSKKPYFNHTLQRTFGPAVAAMTNNIYEYPVLTKQEMDSPIEDDISHVVQGEIARLDSKFKVQLHPLQQIGSKIVRILCKLDATDLPCVPPISIKIPPEYPSIPPQCIIDSDQYNSSQFLKDVYKALNNNLEKLPNIYSITTLLDRWEMSVRQTINYKTNVF